MIGKNLDQIEKHIMAKCEEVVPDFLQSYARVLIDQKYEVPSNSSESSNIYTNVNNWVGPISPLKILNLWSIFI